MPTDIETERECQSTWRLKPKFRGAPWFDALIENEFADPSNIVAAVDAQLARIVQYSALNIPYYADRFRGLGIIPATIRSASDLVRLPILTKDDVQNRFDQLQPARLPPGERYGGTASSSGTTGRKTRVFYTYNARRMFGFLKQREYRWWRYDPLGRQFWCRRPEASLRHPGKVMMELGEMLEAPKWPLLSNYFETGTCAAVALENPVDWIVERIIELEPQMVMSTNARLEHFAYAFRDGNPPKSLKVAQALTASVTPTMRRHIADVLRIPVYQNYGLNEVGIVASQCAEGRRYHVHIEHCWVEIVDEEGVPVPEGGTGRLLVTALNNFAMPLIRYDSGDIAKASKGPCPCGRTLPSFDYIVGRRIRLTALPDGTIEIARAMLDKMADLPREISGGLREYQLHQKADGGFELRVVMANGCNPKFEEHVADAWSMICGGKDVGLVVRKVAASQLTPSNKFMHLTSEFIAPEDGNWTPALFEAS